jgi:hypothetical protein
MSSTSWQWVRANPDEAAHRIRQLERENAALRQDTERLDWLDVNCTRVADSERYLPTTVYWGKGTHQDIRAAIDAARAKEEKP